MVQSCTCTFYTWKLPVFAKGQWRENKQQSWFFFALLLLLYTLRGSVFLGLASAARCGVNAPVGGSCGPVGCSRGAHCVARVWICFLRGCGWLTNQPLSPSQEDPDPCNPGILL